VLAGDDGLNVDNVTTFQLDCSGDQGGGIQQSAPIALAVYLADAERL
jgi:hypothetical protein